MDRCLRGAIITQVRNTSTARWVLMHPGQLGISNILNQDSPQVRVSLPFQRPLMSDCEHVWTKDDYQNRLWLRAIVFLNRSCGNYLYSTDMM